jgi:DNA polymerase III epsilon subunit-like protein
MELGDSHTVLVFDTETTGLPKDWKRPSTDIDNWPRIVQLGMAFQNFGGDVQTYKQLIKPSTGIAFPIPEKATDVHGITDEMCMDVGIPLSEALDMFQFWLSGANVLVAHNMAFDRPIVSCEFIRLGRPISVNKATKLICTKIATTNYVGLPNKYPWGDKYKWPTLQELHSFLFGFSFAGDHDALVDVMATLKCYNELTKRGTFSTQGIFLPTQVSEL